ncbi:hypothetical protein K4K61_010763 [Colletotrichum sp. SAR11_59]|uniref:Major facilitator superfamily transporter n=1 Tax=Colletotrichum asianum TaxID=702518 RepID=A0A8H3WAR7_9PEZI|nr:hypothetical protein GQ607_008227 [Colletotrichum asianum]KAI8299251.1 hypothetical protein K4K61_010763 [Colletotrichum sp. SAR11_59]
MFKQSPLRARARPKTLIFLAVAAFLFYTSWTAYIRNGRDVAIWRHGHAATLAEETPTKPVVPLTEPWKTEQPKTTPASAGAKQQDGSELRKQEGDKKTEEDESVKEWEKQQDEPQTVPVHDEAEDKKKAEEEKRKKKIEEEAKKQKEKQEAEAKRKKKEQEAEAARSHHEQQLRDQFAREYEAAKKLPGSGAIYGNTLASLSRKDDRPAKFADRFRQSAAEEQPWAANQRPVHFDPYPDYNSDEWNKTRRAAYVPCVGALGEPVEDLLVFKGHPRDFPKPGMGGFDIMDMDGDICYERDTRLGQYGLTPQLHAKTGLPIDWDSVKWGDLQTKCAKQNAARFGKGKPNEYLITAYEDIASKYGNEMRKREEGGELDAREDTAHESRTAVLLRTYTGKKYTENDKQVIRALVSELSLRSGGEYEVFLLLHVRDDSVNIFDDKERQNVLDKHIPKEFHSMTKVWNDQAVWDIYTALTDAEERTVHHAQWLSVQKFSIDHPEFDFIWNWEMDVRVVGHNYDFVRRLEGFARNQPRRGLWERNERYYIPAFHGDYDTDFRLHTEQATRGSQVWGPPKVSFINPVGPKPPVANPEDDAYKWGVGEDADLITLGPIFNPVNSSWIFGDNIWGYKDEENPDPRTLPRRTTIVTQSRLSKRLLDIMHVENLRGNHIASEMTPQTVSLLHGFKAVFAPHPTWFDRPWNGAFLDKWFNSGDMGSGGEGSPFGYGRERRYQGTTWYYRAEPPSRLYNNWMGYVDTDIGGRNWEIEHGRPCLPPMILHPVKEVEPTEAGFATRFELNYG